MTALSGPAPFLSVMFLPEYSTLVDGRQCAESCVVYLRKMNLSRQEASIYR